MAREAAWARRDVGNVGSCENVGSVVVKAVASVDQSSQQTIDWNMNLCAKIQDTFYELDPARDSARNGKVRLGRRDETLSNGALRGGPTFDYYDWNDTL
jgi:hypothetical protein